MLTPEQKAKLKTAGYNDGQIAAYEAKKFGVQEDSSYLSRVNKSYDEARQKIGSAVQSGADALNDPNKNVLQKGAKLAETALNTVGAVAGAAAAPITAAIEPVVTPVIQKALENPTIASGAEKVTEWAKKHPQAAQDLQSVVDLATLGVGGSTEKVVENTANNVVKNTENLFKEGIDTIDNTFGKKFIAPDVSEATKVSLNPKEALKGTGQDIKVSVGGKIKNLSEITPRENTRIQTSTNKALNTFTKQAEKFSKDRSVAGGSPVEIVGSRADQALSFADKKRMAVGKQMGEIELKYKDVPVPIGDGPLEAFTDTIKFAENPKYGMATADAEVVQKLVNDFDTLEKAGATVGERLQFIRNWDSYLQDAKDGFGNFKANATVNTKIQNAVKTLKNETVDHVSSSDKIYKKLRSQYSEFKRLEEIGDRLLGKDGALGERVKGAALIKRAIQSNSDAGARQFLAKLKELTGYDAIKEGDLALTAMEGVGDYQGLSLLNIIKEGKTGIANKVLSKGEDLLLGTKAERIKKYVNK